MDEPTTKEITTPKPVLRRKKRKGSLVVACIILLLLILGVWNMTSKKSESVIPDKITSAAGFPVYFPSPVPAGYVLDKKSVRLADGVLFFTFDKGADQIYVTEQAVPPNPPDFKLLTDKAGFKALDIDSGEAISGTSFGKFTVIILTNTTMLNINGAKSVPSDVVISTARNMHSL